MIDVQTIDTKQLRFTVRMICDEALRRNWKVWLYYIGASNIRLQRPDGKILEIYSGAPPTTSYNAGLMANDKFLTNILYEENDLPVPKTFLAPTEDEAVEFSKKLFGESRKVVIKPLDAAHGNGVRVNLSSEEQVREAVQAAQEFGSSGGTVIVQEHLENMIDLRLTCINFEFAGALIRIPARVKGDGTSTVKQLIETENQNPLRGKNYSKTLNIISPESAAIYLGDEINEVPAEGAWKQVLGTANLGTGGETIDVTDEVPDWMIEMAEKASKVSMLPSSGVDFLVNDHPKKEHSIEQLQPKIIEVNKAPALFMHETPTFGKPRNTIAKYIDYLEQL